MLMILLPLRNPSNLRVIEQPHPCVAVRGPLHWWFKPGLEGQMQERLHPAVPLFELSYALASVTALNALDTTPSIIIRK